MTATLTDWLQNPQSLAQRRAVMSGLADKATDTGATRRTADFLLHALAGQVAGNTAGRKAAEKHTALLQLRRQAEELEQQSAALMEEAEAERKRIELAQEKLEEIEQGEWRGYAQAERAEQQRRAVVARAKPAVRTAESREREAMVQKQLAADAHFHAQVLENRARALLKESQDMAALSLKLSTEAARTNSKF